MSNIDSIPTESGSSHLDERRNHPRSSLGSLSYVQLDESNGGILINVSEGGLAVHAAMSVMEESLAQIRLQITHSKKRLDTPARVAWTADSRRMVGLKFENSSEEFRFGLRQWLAAEAAATAKPSSVVVAMPSDIERQEDLLPPPSSASALPRNLRALATATAPVPMQRKAEFDMAALLITESADPAPPSAGDSSASKQSPKQSAVNQVARPKPQPFALVASETERDRPHNVRMILALGVLAAVSLLGGWEAGLGNLFRLFRASPEVSASSSAPASGTVSQPVFANILIIDANNQSWLIPFSGPTDVAKVPASPALPPQSPAARAASEAAQTSTPSFHVGTLYSPRSSVRPATSPSTFVAPTLPSVTGATSLPPTLADAGATIEIAPPTGPAASSSLVPAVAFRRVDPLYPRNALEQRVQGVVKIQAHIGPDGAVTNVKATSGPTLLLSAATDAVRRWQYKPALLDGRPVASDIELTINFKLPQ